MTDRLIYAALVAVWMAYLVPMGIRRYREVAARGSIASFSSSMVALAGNPVRVGTPPGVTVPARVASGATAAARPATGVLDRPSARRAAARRRRVLIVLVGLVALTGVLVVLTTLLWPALLLPIALVVGFLAVSRVQVARQEQAAWARAAHVRAAEAAPRPATALTRIDTFTRIDTRGDANDDETVVIHGDAAVGLAARLARPAGATAYSAADEAGAQVAHGAHPATSADRQPVARDAQPAVAVPAASSGAHPASSLAEQPTPTDGGAHPAPAPAPAPAAPATWDLRPVTLPTYITKSRANRSVRGADRTGSSTWSSGRMPADQQVRGDRVDRPAQQRRVVGG